MISLLRYRVSARLPINHAFVPCSQMMQQEWAKASPLVIVRSFFSTACSQAVSTRYSALLSGFHPLLLPRCKAQRLLVPWPYDVQSRQFSSAPSSAQAKRSNASQRPKGRPPVSRNLPPPAKERPILRRLPAVATYSAPIEVCQPQVQSSYTSKEHILPHAKSTRLAVYCIFCIIIAQYVAWRLCLWQQICIHEGCKDERCGHDLCGPVIWMMDNATISKRNICAHRYWTLITAAVSHANPDHLLSNLLGIAVFAPALYSAGGVGVGAIHIAGLTLGSAVFSNLASVIYNWNQPPSVYHPRLHPTISKWNGIGVSGISCAFAAAATCFQPRKHITIGRFTTPLRVYWVAAFSSSLVSV